MKLVVCLNRGAVDAPLIDSIPAF